MADIFGTSQTDGGAFDASYARMTVGSVSGVIVSSLSANYQRNIQRVYDLASTNAYYVVGVPDGTGSIGCVFGPGGNGNPYGGFGSACKGVPIGFSSSDPCGSSWSRTLYGCRISGVNMTVQAQDMMINENISFSFSNMEVA